MNGNTMNLSRINAQELSSRKLWSLAETQSPQQLSAQELSEVIAELANRCRDLEKQRLIDKLAQPRRG
jgi:hypothetical protein